MRNIGFKLLYVITALVVIVELIFAVKGGLFTNIAELPTGSLKSSNVSPSGEKTLNIYVVKNNLGVAVRGEILNGDDSHNIFWQTGIDEVEALWLNDNTVLINEIPLNADDTFGYDCRRGYSLFDEGSLEQNFTNFRGVNEEE
ncbi:MAG: hypothetical protein E7521_00605 [Ruminococcaceae bacterium]|nr:hypothetical protein [Oscillospiraceae bacterium]